MEADRDRRFVTAGGRPAGLVTERRERVDDRAHEAWGRAPGAFHEGGEGPVFVARWQAFAQLAEVGRAFGQERHRRRAGRRLEEGRSRGFVHRGQPGRIPNRRPGAGRVPQDDCQRQVPVVVDVPGPDPPAVGWVGALAPKAEVERIEREDPADRLFRGVIATAPEVGFFVPGRGRGSIPDQLARQTIGGVGIDRDVEGIVDDRGAGRANAERVGFASVEQGVVDDGVRRHGASLRRGRAAEYADY